MPRIIRSLLCVLLLLLLGICASGCHDGNNVVSMRFHVEENIIDEVPIIIDQTGIRTFEIRAKVKKGSVNISLLKDDASIWSMDGSEINEKVMYALEPGIYTLRVKVDYAEDGTIRVWYW